MSFRPLASAEWRNPPRGIMNHHKIKLAAWEDSSTPFHFARNDMSGGGSVLSAWVLFGTLLGDESSPLHGVVPFNHTSYIRDVVGGRLPPLRTHRWVIPFIRTGCIRSAPGTAHRPFPTVSLKGSKRSITHRLASPAHP